MSIVIFRNDGTKEVIYDVRTLIRSAYSLDVETTDYRSYEFDPSVEFVML